MQMSYPKATENEMVAFLVICDIAKCGVSDKKNWKLLGYSCPYTVKWLFSCGEKRKKAKLLYEILFDRIVVIGLSIIDVNPQIIDGYLSFNKKEISVKLYSDCLNRIRNMYIYRFQGLKRDFNSDMDFYNRNISVFYRFKECGLSTNDVEWLENKLYCIEMFYENVFSNVFIDFKK